MLFREKGTTKRTIIQPVEYSSAAVWETLFFFLPSPNYLLYFLSIKHSVILKGLLHV